MAKEQITDLIGSIYDAVLSPEQWPDAWGRLARLVPVSQIAFGAMSPLSGQFRFLEMLEDRPEQAALFMARYSQPQTNPLVRAALDQSVGKPMFSHRQFTHRDLVRMEIYEDLLRPLDYHFILAFNLICQGSLFCNWSMYRSRLDKPFRTSDFAKLSPFIPHLRRFAQLRMHLQAVNDESAGMLAVMERLDFGLILLDTNGRVRHENAAARSILRRGVGLRVRHGELRAELNADDSRLQSLIRSAVSTGEHCHVSPGGEMLLRGGLAGIRLLLAPAGANTALPDMRCIRAMVLLFDGERTQARQSEILCALYGLTPTETIVAVTIARGKSPRHVAAALGIGLTTVRTHLYRAMDKLGVHTQPGLVAKLLGLSLGATTCH